MHAGVVTHTQRQRYWQLQVGGHHLLDKFPAWFTPLPSAKKNMPAKKSGETYPQEKTCKSLVVVFHTLQLTIPVVYRVQGAVANTAEGCLARCNATPNAAREEVGIFSVNETTAG